MRAYRNRVMMGLAMMLLAAVGRAEAPRMGAESFSTEPVVSARACSLVMVEENRVEVMAVIEYKARDQGAQRLAFSLPPAARAVKVSGASIAERSLIEREGRLLAAVSLERPATGAHRLFVEFEIPFDPKADRVEAPLIRPEEVSFYEASLGIAALHNLEIGEQSVEEMRRIDPKQLSGAVFEDPGREPLRAYSYQGLHGQESASKLVLTVARHAGVAFKDAFIDEARFLTLVQDNGFSVTKAVFIVRNKGRQNLKLELPAESEIWSAFIGDSPVPAAVDEKKRVLIPLPRSEAGDGGELTGIPVEVVYRSPLDPMKRRGKINPVLVKPDLAMGRAAWQIYLPDGRVYSDFSGALGPVIAEPGSPREAARDLSDFFTLKTLGFTKMLAKSKQSEAKTNLGAIFTGQVSFHGEHNAYGETFDRIAWRPEGQNLYTYLLAADRYDTHPMKGRPLSGWDLGTTVTPEAFTALAVGNMDNDPFPDVWMINEKKELVNLANDVTNTYDPLYHKLKERGLVRDLEELKFKEALEDKMSRADFKGMLSLRIDVPAEGKLFRFSRLFPGAQGEKLGVTIKYKTRRFQREADLGVGALLLPLCLLIGWLAALRREKARAFLSRHFLLTAGAAVFTFIAAARVLW